MMMNLRNNKYIEKLLNSSVEYWGDFPSLSYEQLEWRFENSPSLIGIIGKGGFFARLNQAIILKNSEGNYVLFSPRSIKDKYPAFLYDILNIEEFVKRYPVRNLYTNETVDQADLDEAYDNVEVIKDSITRGFIETRDGEPTRVYEIC